MSDSAINRDKIRERLSQLEAGGNGDREGKENKKQSLWFKPEIGHTYIVRLVPYSHLPSDEPPIVVLHQHGLLLKNEQRRLVVCERKTSRETCSICGVLSDVWNGLGEKHRALAKEIYKQHASKLFFMSLCLVDEDAEVSDPQLRLWSMPKTIYKGILEVYNDPEYGSVHDIKNGKKLKVKCFKEQNKLYQSYTVTPKPSAAPLSKAEMDIIKKSPHADMNILKNMLETRSSHVMQKEVAGWCDYLRERYPDAAKHVRFVLSADDEAVGFEEKHEDGTAVLNNRTDAVSDQDLPF